MRTTISVLMLTTALVLSGCSVMESVGEDIADVMPMTQGQAEELEARRDEHVDSSIAEAISGHPVEAAGSGLAALMLTVLLSRFRRRGQIKAAKAQKAVEKWEAQEALVS